MFQRFLTIGDGKVVIIKPREFFPGEKGNIAVKFPAIMKRQVLPPVLTPTSPFAEMAVYKRDIRRTHSEQGTSIRLKRGLNRPVARITAFIEKKCPRNLTKHKHVIIKIDKMLRKVGNPVHIKFQWIAAERRQSFRRHIIGMLHNMQAGIVLFKPRRQMPACDKMYFANPWRAFFYGTEPLTQIIPVTEAIRSRRRFIRAGRPVIFFFLPFRISSVHPKNYEVNIKVFHSKAPLYPMGKDQ